MGRLGLWVRAGCWGEGALGGLLGAGGVGEGEGAAPGGGPLGGLC